MLTYFKHRNMSLANHYLRPEDLSPLPTTLDAKNSPLALLAQTCSNIGADLLPNNRSNIIPPLEKPKKSDSRCRSSDSASSGKRSPTIDASNNRSNSSTSSSCCAETNNRISFKPYETKSGKSELPSANNKTNGSNNSNNHGNNSRSNSVDVVVDKDHKKSSSTSASASAAAPSSNRTPSSTPSSEGGLKRDSDNQSHDHNHKRNTPTTISSTPSSNPHSESKGKTSSPTTTSAPSPSPSSTPFTYTSQGIAELAKSQLTQLSKSEPLSTGCKTSSALNGYNGYHSLSGGHDLLKSSPHFSASPVQRSNHPYMSAHHQAAAALRGAASVCRDPYCKGCQLGLGGLPCANGCSQCVHPQHSPHPQHPYSSASLGLSALGGHLPPGYISGLPTPKPFVCHWTAGGSYCGKSFNSCEDLLQHLKTHTITSSSFPGLGYYNQPQALPPGLSGIRSSAALDSLRYHPYKLTSTGVPGALPAGMGSAPGHFCQPSSVSSPTMSLFPGHHPSLASYYGLLNGRLAGHSSLP